MSEIKSYANINKKLAAGEAVVFTADEYKALAETGLSDEELVRRVDVVTVATFAPMCSSGVFINFGHGSPPIRLETATLNGVPAYGGIAAVDLYLGATAEHPENPDYGGAHVIEDLICGRRVLLEAQGKGTDCYPGRSVRTWIDRGDLNDFYFFNPRNVYQNYGAAVNSGGSRLHTYLGVLEPHSATVSYATAGELSPLLNDPQLRTIGIGTAVSLGGAVGQVVRAGTQYNTTVAANAAGVPRNGARTLALQADALRTDPRWVAAARVEGYGISLFLGAGFAIPLLDPAIARALRIRDRDINVQIKDFARPERPIVLESDYAQLRSGSVQLPQALARTACSSSLLKARQLCAELKTQVLGGSFPVRPFLEALPAEQLFRPLKIRAAAADSEGAGSEPGLAAPGRRGKAGYARSLCVDCGACAAHCPSGALRIGAPDWVLHYDDEACTGCGLCRAACLRCALLPVGRAGNAGRSLEPAESVTVVPADPARLASTSGAAHG